VLVVEDELLIRLIVSDELREAGYDVIEAFNADEALTILRSPAPVDLIISDVRMPGSVDGLGLLVFVREAFPEIPVILTSGHLEAAHALASGAIQFLPKPFGLEVILGAVQNALKGPA
jgi:DNA-binding NtrC family response regulator